MSQDTYRQFLEEIKAYCLHLKRPLPQLVAVSKFQPLEKLQWLYAAGCRDFAESRVQEALEKKALLPSDIRWHLIGHLQSNKVGRAVGAFSLIHSVHSPELLFKIAEKGVDQRVLLQVNTSGESSKQGLSVEEWNKVVWPAGVHVIGLMTMAPHIEDEEVIRRSFRRLRLAAEKWQLPELSMGMSGDWKIALEEGATIVRIGRALFA